MPDRIACLSLLAAAVLLCGCGAGASTAPGPSAARSGTAPAAGGPNSDSEDSAMPALPGMASPPRPY